ncbi:MAG: VapE domain-containing protein [Flectobacillus sp.]|uniref:VapE domain-containing protein n=1 Tax=Flectobacillus sp. TaxID=50419 RepID=UPI003B9952B8
MEQTNIVPNGELCLSDLDKYINQVCKTDLEVGVFEEKKKAMTKFHKVKKELERYDLRLDSIKLEIEYSEKGKNDFRPLNDSNLYVELREKNIKISKADLKEILKSDFVRKVNPIDNYFRNLPPYEDDEPDYIEQLSSYVYADCQSEFNKHFKKHLVRSVKCALDDNYFNKQALILVQPGQNTGKTSFCRFLCPPTLKDYFAEDITTDKDGLILLAKNFLINLDELSTLHKSEINALKSYFSKSWINVRIPFDSKNSNISRKCSFIGSTNLGQFLADETGSVRWLCFQINSINWSYSNDVNIDNVWRQAYYLYNTKYKCDLTPEEIQENEKRNASYQIVSIEEDLVVKFLEVPNESNQHRQEFLQSSDITSYLQQSSGFTKINSIQVGKVLSKYFKREKKMKHKIQVYGYWVVKSSI